MIKTKYNVDMGQHIRESNLIEGFDDPDFDLQGMYAWEYLLEVPFDSLTDHHIQKVQKIVTLKQTDLRPDERGYYRKVPVWIGGRQGLKAELVPQAMKNLITIVGFTNPKAWHVEFEKIHPCVDGNGRTGRLLMWWQQVQRGEEPTLILNAEKQKYYRWFNA